MRNPFFHRRPTSKSSGRPTALRRLAVDRLEDRLVPASVFTVNSLLDTASPPTGVTTLRSAIVAANADHNTDSAHPDIITFSVTGSIALTSALPALTEAVSIQGPGASALTVLGTSGGTYQPILTVSSPATAAISGLTLDGNAHLNSGIAVGSGASLTFQDANVQNADTNGNGGGISITGGSVTVTRGRFLADYAASGDGGGIANVGGSLTVTQSTFDSGFADTFGGGISDAPGSTGGGGTLTVLASTFSNNFTESYGGGLGVFHGGQATIADSTFTGNTAGVGGGIAVLSGASSLVLTGSTVADNTAGPGQAGGGLFVQVTTTATMRDTIIATNSGGDVYGAVDPTSGFNLIGDGTSLTGLINGTNGNMIGTTAQPMNPKLGPLQNNGGPAQTMALLPGSPALDRGGPSTVLDAMTSTDECGTPRVVAQSFVVPPSGGDGRDIGSYELPAQTVPTVLTVNTLTEPAATQPPGVLTLRQAIQAADGLVSLSSLPAAQVSLGSAYLYEIQFSVAGTVALTTALPAIGNTGVSLQGPGATALTIVGDGQSDAILTVAPGGAAVVTGLTLDGNGHLNSGIAVGSGASLNFQDATVQNTSTNGSGGGISITGGSVTVTRGRLLADYAASGAGYGGGIANVGGTLTVTQSTLDSGFAGEVGGGIYDAPGSTGGGGTLTVLASTFSNNITEGYGGGLGVFHGGQATVENSTFSGNFAGVGGGIAVLSGGPSNLDLISSTVANNTAGPGQAGGGLYVQVTTTATVQDTIIATNSGGDVYGAVNPTSDHNLIGDGTSLTGLTNGTNGNMIGTTASPMNPELLPLQDNGGPTLTMALLPESPAIDVGSNPANLTTDQRGDFRDYGAAPDIGAYEYETPINGFGVQIPPGVASVVIDGGAAQRSMVTTVAVTFSEQVTFASSPAAAFVVSRVSDGALVSFTATVSTVGGATVVTLSGFTGSATQYGSLADGRYTLRVLANQVSFNGLDLDGDNDGDAGVDYVSPTDTQSGGPGQLHLYRIFGDATGDGIVDQLDLAQFRSAFNSSVGNPPYLSYLDVDNSGNIDQVDLAQFRERFNSSVFPSSPGVTPAVAPVPAPPPPPATPVSGTTIVPPVRLAPSITVLPVPNALRSGDVTASAAVQLPAPAAFADPFSPTFQDADNSGLVDQVDLGQFGLQRIGEVL